MEMWCTTMTALNLQMWKQHQDIYIYIPGTQMISIFEGQPPKTRFFPIKTRVIWVPGIYKYADIHWYIPIYAPKWLLAFNLLSIYQISTSGHRPYLFSRETSRIGGNIPKLSTKKWTLPRGYQIPDAPCREYLPTFPPLNVATFLPNVGK